MKKFCKALREHMEEIINYEKRKLLLLAKEEKKLYSKQKCFHIYRKEFSDYNDDDSNLYKVRDHCHSN